MKALITVFPGDGIGPEVVAEARKVLDAIASRFGHQFTLQDALIGGAAIDATGSALPDEALAAAREANAILLGAVGGPKWSDPKAAVRPEQGLLAIRRALGLYANLRPVRVHPALAAHSPVRAERIEGVDLLFVRELTGGIYFGEKTRDADSASDLCRYTRAEIERVVRMACQLALPRRAHLTQVDKANVLETSRLWREVTTELVATEFPQITLSHQLVDSMAMHLITGPKAFDVIVTENLFGDVLTDEAAVLTGSLGMLPSASLGDDGIGLYEPIHGSAPDIAGRGIANPIGTIASVAMLLRLSLRLEAEAAAVEAAIDAAIAAQMLSADLLGAQGKRTADIGDFIAQTIRDA